jgi:hypothetical protein
MRGALHVVSRTGPTSCRLGMPLPYAAFTERHRPEPHYVSDHSSMNGVHLETMYITSSYPPIERKAHRRPMCLDGHNAITTGAHVTYAMEGVKHQNGSDSAASTGLIREPNFTSTVTSGARG